MGLSAVGGRGGRAGVLGVRQSCSYSEVGEAAEEGGYSEEQTENFEMGSLTSSGFLVAKNVFSVGLSINT